jgi:hypothetical protein
MHSCDNRQCVNPAHLIGSTQSANMKDAVKKGRISQLILDQIELGKISEAKRAARRSEHERKKALGPQLCKDGKYRDYMGRICKPGQVLEEPMRDRMGRMCKPGQVLPDPIRGVAGRFTKQQAGVSPEQKQTT